MVREIMTPEQVADYLQVDRETVYRLIRRRQLAATKVGRTYRIPRQDLENFLTDNSTQSEVRDALFDRVMVVAERNPGLNSDDVLAELEREDDDRRQQRVSEADAVLIELERRRSHGLSITDQTAGILKPYAKVPAPTPHEEKEAFEQAVTDQVVESMRR
jgi:excisionase family DNA binding protein